MIAPRLRSRFGWAASVSRRVREASTVLANNSQYGLSGYVQTADLGRALRVAEELVSGEVMINGAPNMMVGRPYGGVGLSGVGKEGGRHGIEEFLRIKGVGIAG